MDADKTDAKVLEAANDEVGAAKKLGDKKNLDLLSRQIDIQWSDRCEL